MYAFAALYVCSMTNAIYQVYITSCMATIAPYR
jgi:hypothetical protein